MDGSQVKAALLTIQIFARRDDLWGVHLVRVPFEPLAAGERETSRKPAGKPAAAKIGRPTFAAKAALYY